MNKVSFEVFWTKLVDALSNEEAITNWTNDKGTFGENFVARSLISNYINVKIPSAINTQKVPKADFELVYDNWRQYLDGDLRRSELMKQSRFTKYTISIIRQYRNLMVDL